ncbi:hypothetical protein LY90DRAFT_516623 [Neocallimastix californiae]|uniref:MATH domain-containing protein n=1 Tax=Neocallimastix californiae TaxID=1754190 RepID=A0A1Y2AEH4_9FUNG|nr:hypothetical protein LY90DRAFT_516623 [Neocallimastix californiae]|eukprot:ORY20667.1 hypothetical protein LY90DRAFT_516623 [Neocallimastix californiae]
MTTTILNLSNKYKAIIIKEGKIHIKCYSFSLDEDYYHVKCIIRIRCSDDFSEGFLLEENKFFNKESEITFSEKLKNIKTQNKIDNIEKINETDTIVICVYIVEYLNIEENHINKLKNILLEDDLENKNYIKKTNRNYFEYKIENFTEFLNEINERSSKNFEVGNYKCFINDIRDKGIDNEYEIINNNYSEWEIDDWDKLQKENITTISSPLFTEKKYYWNVTFFPKEENFSQILYFTSNYNNNENNNIYLRCIFVIRNCNDFSCYEIQKSKISSLEYNMELRNDTIEDNIILPIKTLKSYEISKRHLIENNKVIFGVYIFKMKKKERK